MELEDFDTKVLLNQARALHNTIFLEHEGDIKDIANFIDIVTELQHRGYMVRLVVSNSSRAGVTIKGR